MTYRAIRSLFEPKKVIYVPASAALDLGDALLARNFAANEFKGEMTVVRASPSGALGEDCPIGADLAVVSLPQHHGAAVMQALGERRCKAVLLIGSGPAALPAEQREAVRSAARAAGMRLLGPSRIGVLVPSLGLLAGATEARVHPGHLALLTQSDSIASSMLDWAYPRNMGFSRVVSVGELSAVALGDVLDYLALDPQTRAILLYVERIADTRRFMTAARFAARLKPVIVVRGGASVHESVAAQCFAGGKLVSSEAVYNAAFNRAGLVRVLSITQLFDAAYALSAPMQTSYRGLRAGRLSIISNGRAPALLAADTLVSLGGVLAQPSPQSQAELAARLPTGWSGLNPLDLGPDARPEDYRAAVECLSKPGETDAVLVLHSPSAGSRSYEISRAVAAAVDERAKQGISALASWQGDTDAAESRRTFAEHHIPSFATPERAVRAFLYRVSYERARELVRQIPSSIPDDGPVRPHRAAAIIDSALAQGVQRINGTDALALLDAYAMPVAPTRAVASVDDALRAAQTFGYPVALRWQADGQAARNVLAVDDEAELAVVMTELARKRAATKSNSATYVQALGAVANPVAVTLGMRLDAQFGPVLYFGLGGAALNVAADLGVALPPLNDLLARSLMQSTRAGRTIESGPAAREVEGMLVSFSRVIAEQPAIAAMEIEALVGEDGGVAVVAAQALLDATAANEQPAARLAIRPYPAELEETIELRSGETVKMRPIRPEDARALQRAFTIMTPEDVRMRLFAPVNTLSDEMAARMTQVDYDREMAFVIEDPKNPGELWGGARVVSDPDNVEAEFSVTVLSNLKGHGVGAVSLSRILDYAAARGIETVWGSVLAENRPMLKLAERLGFTCRRDPEDPEVMKCVIDLRGRRGEYRG
jgi:acetyltransferase